VGVEKTVEGKREQKRKNAEENVQRKNAEGKRKPDINVNY